ncbi:MAG TPA: ABC transporter permease [Blastocatellia bacterium]|nr:ABC transporter permease [Blastocatellia bacterium]
MLKNYFKIALKVLLRRKFFTFISLFAVSFTLVVLMVAVSFLDHVFGPNQVESRNDRTLGVFFMEMKTPDKHGTWNGTTGYRFLDRNTRNLPNVEKMSIFSEPRQVVSYLNGQKIQSYLKRADGEFWQILTFRFIEGAPYTPDDEKNRNFVAVINEATRQKFFGNEPAVGKTIEADGQNFRVVGVVENVPYLRQIPFADIWVPISTAKNDKYRNEMMGDFMALYLARSASDFQAIRDEFKARLANIEFPDPKEWNSMNGEMNTYFESISRELVGSRDDNGRSSRPGRLIAAMIIIAILFMLLPTVNLININVSRIMERASEIGVRKAFGASSWTLVGQFIVENIMLTVIGGAIGFLLSRFILQFITSSGWFPYADFYMNYRIFLSGFVLAVFFGLLSGVYPAWKMSRLNPVQALKGGVR